MENQPVDATRPNANRLRRVIFLMIIVNVVLPIVLYAILSNYMDDVWALLISGIPPAIEALIAIVKDHRLDVIPCAVITSIALSAVVASLTHDARLLLVKDSFITLAFGLTFLGSMCLTKENLIWYYNRQFQGPEAKETLDAMYAKPGVRRVTNSMCIVWGTGLLLEAAVRIVLIYILEISTMAYVSPILIAVTFTSLAVWNAWYVRYIRAKYMNANATETTAQDPQPSQTQYKASSSTVV